MQQWIFGSFFQNKRALSCVSLKWKISWGQYMLLPKWLRASRSSKRFISPLLSLSKRWKVSCFVTKNTPLDYTEPQLLPFVAPVFNAEVSIKHFFQNQRTWRKLHDHHLTGKIGCWVLSVFANQTTIFGQQDKHPNIASERMHSKLCWVYERPKTLK